MTEHEAGPLTAEERAWLYEWRKNMEGDFSCQPVNVPPRVLEAMRIAVEQHDAMAHLFVGVPRYPRVPDDPFKP